MSRLPKNVFDSPFKNTASSEPAARAGEGGRLAVVAEHRTAPSVPQPAAESVASTPVDAPPRSSPSGPAAGSTPVAEPVDKRPERKYTVYLNDQQVLGLNEKIFALRAKGVRARDANLTKIISAAVDYYLANDDL